MVQDSFISFSGINGSSLYLYNTCNFINLVVGILGELSLGHAGFMCVGAFSSAFFSKTMSDTITNSSLRFFIALLIGIVVAAIFGIIIGIPVLRLKGDYLAIVTLALEKLLKTL